LRGLLTEFRHLFDVNFAYFLYIRIDVWLWNMPLTTMRMDNLHISPDVLQKLLVKHGVLREEVEQCFLK
jgi:hypothetical protein